MTGKKIIPNREIQWQGDEVFRLSYDRIFSDDGSGDFDEPDSAEEKVDIDGLLRKQEQEWNRKLEKARREAYQLGVEEGTKTGLEEAEAKLDQKLQSLENGFRKAHREWVRLRDVLEPGLLDLVFEISEAILSVPVDNPEIREGLEPEIGRLLQNLDKASRPVLEVSEEDFSFMEKLKETYAPDIPVTVRAGGECRPGEYRLETDLETIQRDYRTMLADFKKSLALPSWKE